jgi:DNA-directed RNA polymerases I and III subunit RPAC1
LNFLKAEAEATDQDTLEFELKIKCILPKDGKKDDKSTYINHKVFSSQIKWIPNGDQATRFKPEDIGPIHNDILINKLNPGQVIIIKQFIQVLKLILITKKKELDLKLYAVKGIGKDHAKFSPVGKSNFHFKLQN